MSGSITKSPVIAAEISIGKVVSHRHHSRRHTVLMHELVAIHFGQCLTQEPLVTQLEIVENLVPETTQLHEYQKPTESSQFELSKTRVA
jgi:hypothetical protein